MRNNDEKLRCPKCKKPWVNPQTGLWDICDFCPHRIPPEATPEPTKETLSRQSARKKLICGGSCKAPNADIIETENDLSYCAKCPNSSLVKEAADKKAKKAGKRNAVEYIHPAPRKTVGYWKQLYFDLLQRHAAALDEIERLRTPHP